jgi:hypothetical protein
MVGQESETGPGRLMLISQGLQLRTLVNAERDYKSSGQLPQYPQNSIIGPSRGTKDLIRYLVWQNAFGLLRLTEARQRIRSSVSAS